MPGPYYPRMKSMPPPPWLAKAPGSLRAMLQSHVDADAESAAAIFRRFNLIRFCAGRTFREFVARRRRLIHEYNLRRAQMRHGHSVEDDAQPGERTMATGAGVPGG